MLGSVSFLILLYFTAIFHLLLLLSCRLLVEHLTFCHFSTFRTPKAR